MTARATGRRGPRARTKRMATLMLSAGILVGATGTVGLITSTVPAAASGAPITIAYVTSVTGPGASEDGTSPAAFEARLDLQNAEGGVNGHKLVPLIIDDQTSPTEIATAVQEADSKAFGIVSQSPLFFLAAKYAQQQGVPVTGSYSDGPEWGQQPYTNMFAADVGSLNPKYPVTTLAGNFLKQHGATVLATYGYGISPSSSRAAIQTADSFKHAGGKVGVLNTTVPFGGTAFTPDALVAKQNGVNALGAQYGRQFELRTGRRSPPGGGQAQGRTVRDRLRTKCDQLAGLVLSAGGLLLRSVPSVVASQRGNAADAGRHGEVRPLQQERLPLVQPVRGVAGC